MGHRVGFWDLLDYIVEEPAPRVPAQGFSPQFGAFMDLCLQKQPEKRSSASALLEHPWCQLAKARKFDFKGWVQAALFKVPQKVSQLNVTSSVDGFPTDPME